MTLSTMNMNTQPSVHDCAPQIHSLHLVLQERVLTKQLAKSVILPFPFTLFIGDRAFAVAGPRAWNTLPDFITDCSSSCTFKQYLKTYLFSLSF